MPAVIALLIRSALQMAVTLGVIALAERILAPVVDWAKAQAQRVFGIDEDEAEAWVGNEVIDAGVAIGIGTLTLRSKLPTRVAESLGFSTKGFRYRPLKPETHTKIIKAGGAGNLQSKAATAATREEAARQASLLSGARSLASGAGRFFGKALNTTFLAFLVGSQFIDYGNWNSGAYQKTFQKIFAKLGLKVDEEWRKTTSVSPDIFTKIYNALKDEGAVGFSDPYKQQSVLFTRDNAVDLIQKVGSHALLENGQASTKDVLEVVLLLTVFKEAGPTAARQPDTQRITTPATQGVAQITAPTPQDTVTTNIRVFSGLVVQGVLADTGAAIVRESDLIENTEELELAAKANLVPFVAALPGRIRYEIRIVASVVDKDGFRRTGEKRQIQIGVYKNGKPKFKTVQNKWAVVDLYVFTHRKTRTKIDELILGPVNSAVFSPSTVAVAQVAAGISGSILTTSLDDVESIQSNKSLTVRVTGAGEAATGGNIITIPKSATSGADSETVVPEQPQAAPEPEDREQVFRFQPRDFMWRVWESQVRSNPDAVKADLIGKVQEGHITEENVKYALNSLGIPWSEPLMPRPATPASQLGLKVPKTDYLRHYTESEIIRQPNGEIYLKPGVPQRWSEPAPTPAAAPAPTLPPPAPAPAPTQPQPPAGAPARVALWSSRNPNPCGVDNIAEFFDPSKQIYPPLATRAAWYEQFGLGSRDLYVGTAEQNNKLLVAIKREFGCPM